MRSLPLYALMLTCAGLAACSDPDSAGRDGEAAVNDTLPGVDDAGADAGTASAPTDTSPAAVAAARRRAQEMVGDAFPSLGKAEPRPGDAHDTPAMVMAARAAVAPGGADCAVSLGYSAAWAGKLPGTFPVYPRANTLEAAGTDEGECALRVVTFRTPVPVGEVLGFYAARARAAGFGAEHIAKGEDQVLSGMKGASAYVVYARHQPEDGTSEIDLVTSGS